MPRRTSGAFLWYVAMTIALTWPVSAGLARDVPSDLGDPLLNCWILGWNATRIERLATGDLGALRGWWNGNIFHPEPLSLAYSELLLAQSVQIAPVHALTDNLILCYNLLFLSTFALSALGAYLLVRDLTGDWRPAFIAGLIFGFAPYRTNQLAHLQVLSSQWMPFALVGFRRFVVTGRLRALAAGVAALVAQNLSCGYFLVFFSIFVPPFVVFELWRHGRIGDRKRWAWLAGAGAIVALCTLPFMLPYVELRELTGQKRWIEEVITYSADVGGWATADRNLRLWGHVLRTFPRLEGDLFPGAAAIALSAFAVGVAAARAWRATSNVERLAQPSVLPWRGRLRSWIAIAAIVFGSIQILGVLMAIAGLIGRYAAGPFLITIGSVEKMLQRGLAAAGILLLISARTRAFVRAAWSSPVIFFALAACLAWWLSLGPAPTSFAHPLNGPKIYELVYYWIPGADGLRVPARIAMVVALLLSVLAGYGSWVLMQRIRQRDAALLALALCAVIVAESAAAPIPVNRSSRRTYHRPPVRVVPGSEAPRVYGAVAALPAAAVLVEFPFGDPAWELQHVYYSTMHFRPLLNGYSGWFPPGYAARARVLRDVRRDPEGAWRALQGAGATHAVVHRDAYADRRAEGLPEWLQSHGARLIGSFGRADLYALPPSQHALPPSQVP